MIVFRRGNHTETEGRCVAGVSFSLLVCIIVAPIPVAIVSYRVCHFIWASAAGSGRKTR